MKYVGIDFGTKHIGLAVSDEEGKVAFPRKTRERTKNIVEDVLSFIEEERAQRVVCGMPQDVPETWRDDIKEFADTLRERGVDLMFQDESFSSHEAHHSAHQFGLKNIDTDQSAAVLILQRYLDTQNNGNN